MFAKKSCIYIPPQLLNTYHLEVRKLIHQYKLKKGLSQKALAKKMQVSEAYLSQMLNGKSNYTLNTIIELGLIMGKYPYFEYVEKDEFWRRRNIPYHIKINQPFPWPTPKT